MPKLTYTNERGQSIVLGDSAPLLVTKMDGIGGVQNTIYRHKTPSQDGTTATGSTLGERELTIEGVILATDQAVYRQKLLQTFNPKLTGILQYKKGLVVKEIGCRAELAPAFPSDFSKNYQIFLITLLCPNPFWQDIEQIKAEIALWVGDFSFPLEMIEVGAEMGHREPSLIVNTFNPGDVECGMRVELKALATLTNPSILNVDTQEYLKINKTMEAGEVITVTTRFGAKKVENKLNGVTTNAFNYIDLGSTFLQLDVGDNLFRYNADTNIDNLEVSIYYTPQYLGV